VSAAHKDDRARELLEWVKGRESDGVIPSDMVGEIAIEAKKRGLTPKTMSLNAGTGIREVPFVETELVLVHDGSEWQLA
jgi:hypothetical protein